MPIKIQSDLPAKEILENENIFVNEKGVWKELHYIPAFVRSYPFILSNNK